MSIFERFKTTIKLTGYVYDMQRHQGWGNAINWLNYDKRRISGGIIDERIYKDNDTMG